MGKKSELAKPKCYWYNGKRNALFDRWLKVKFGLNNVYFKKNDDYWDDYKGQNVVIFEHIPKEWWWDIETACRVKQWTWYKRCTLKLTNGDFIRSNCDYFIVMTNDVISMAFSAGSRCFREEFSKLFKRSTEIDLFHGNLFRIKQQKKEPTKPSIIKNTNVAIFDGTVYKHTDGTLCSKDEIDEMIKRGIIDVNKDKPIYPKTPK